MPQDLADALSGLTVAGDSSAATPELPGPGGKGKGKSRSRRRPAPLPGAKAVASPPLKIDGTPQKPSPNPRFIVRKKDWGDMPDWIVLEDERGTDDRGKPRPFLALQDDPLFSDDGGPLLLPFLPPEGVARGRGAAVVCPGGNYEFLHPREGPPVARWLAEALGIPALVLRYRLLPQHGLAAMHEDFFRAVSEARRQADGGPVVVVGFSAGGHLCASGCAAAAAEVAAAATAAKADDTSGATGSPTKPPAGSEEAASDAGASPASSAASAAGGKKRGGGRKGGAASSAASAAPQPAPPDAQVLVYPCTNPDGWLLDDECGFWRAEVDSPQVKSLVAGRERLRDGADFTRPPPTFLVASTADDCCPVDRDADPYADAARRAGAPVEYLRGDFGDHGFGLKRFWAEPCVAWLRDLGFGCGAHAGHGGGESAASGPAVTREVSAEVP